MAKQSRRFALLSAAVLLSIGAGAAGASLASPHARAASVPSGLPSHFGIGLAGHPDDSGIYGWMPDSGIPWDYAYQYLAGGVNTGSGWETWNSNGQFALYYAQGAASHNYIPTFSYYELLQSNGSCGSCGEAQKDLSNLNNPSTMASYFSNFTTLMKRLGSGTYDGIAGFGKTAIVHIEPDLSGFAEQAVLNNGSCYGYCTGQGNNPAYLKAAVASSGDTDVSHYPNTYQGFNWALLHLRDLYAPNVKLAFHASNWATGTDIGGDTSSSLNATALGQEAGSFAAQSGFSGVPSGTSSYDLVFNDVSDRDAGYYKYVYGNANAFWDRQNVTFPNFHRWESYISAITQATGRPAMIWQIPLGNQYFDTENNTNGHYQDNRAEYFFGHISELAQSGIIGLLFGAGNGGSTVNNDGMGDGVTNPAQTCDSDGNSSGQICANHTSTVSDDDGGYIRMEARQYFASGGYPLGGGSAPTATPIRPTSTAVPPTATRTATKTPVPPKSTPTKTPVPPKSTPTKTPVPPTKTPAPPTATRTATPRATNTPAPATNTPAAVSVSVTGASASPASVAPGSSVNLAATIDSSTALSGAVVDLEVYDVSGNKIYQTYQSPVTFAANRPQTIKATMPVTSSQAAGTYTFKVGVFGAGWAPLYTWDNNAATFAVGAGSAATPVPPTATPRPTNTPVPPTATPRPTNTATPAGPLTVQAQGSVSAATITRGGTETLTAKVSSNKSISSVLVDFELWGQDASGMWQKVCQSVPTAALNAGSPLTLSQKCAIPTTATPGSYYFKVGVFGPSWSPLYVWNDAAGSITVQ